MTTLSTHAIRGMADAFHECAIYELQTTLESVGSTVDVSTLKCADDETDQFATHVLWTIAMNAAYPSAEKMLVTTGISEDKAYEYGTLLAHECINPVPDGSWFDNSGYRLPYSRSGHHRNEFGRVITPSVTMVYEIRYNPFVAAIAFTHLTYR